MKVGFCGAHGTGKTSVCREFEKRNPDWNIVGSIARRYKTLGFLINDNANPLSQLLTTVGRINAENKLSGKILTERTVVDHLAYSIYQQENVWNSKDGAAVVEESYDLVKEHIKSYDIIVHFPVYWAPRKDSYRLDSVAYQKEIGRLMDDLLKQLGVECVTMDNESVAHRVKKIEHAIGL